MSGCKQAALLGVGPKESHDLVILDRHAEEVVPHVPVQGDEASVLLGLQTRESVHAAAYSTGNVGMGLSLPDVIIFIEARVQEDTVVPNQLVPGPKDEHVHQQGVARVLGVLEPECFQLRLHLIGDVTERLTPEGRAHNLAIGGEAAIFLALFLKDPLQNTIVLSETMRSTRCCPRRSSG